MRLIKFLSVLLFLFALVPVSAQKYLSKNQAEITSEWEGSSFSSTKSLSENISQVPQLSLWSKMLAIPATERIVGDQEMVTLFVVTDAAFMKLPKKSRDSIINNPRVAQSLIKYLAVPGRIDSHSLHKEASKRSGEFSLATLDGQKLRVRERNGKITLIDPENRTATVEASDFYHKNGLFHLIDAVILPSPED